MTVAVYVVESHSEFPSGNVDVILVPVDSAPLTGSIRVLCTTPEELAPYPVGSLHGLALSPAP